MFTTKLDWEQKAYGTITCEDANVTVLIMCAALTMQTRVSLLTMLIYTNKFRHLSLIVVILMKSDLTFINN